MSTASPCPPPGYHSVTVSLTIKGAAEAIEFYQKAFGAVESYRLPSPDGTVMHAEFKIGDSVIMISDEFPDWGCLSPGTVGGCPTTFMIYVPDVDAAYEKAVKAGATARTPVANQFWGDRSGALTDPYGYKWSLATRVEEVNPAEIRKRFAEWMSQQSPK